MFTVVRVKENKKSRWKVFCERFTKAEVNYKEIEINDSKSFYVCEAETHRGKIPWKEIKRLSPSEHFILPFGTEENEAIKEYEPKALPEIMLFNSAVSYIRKMNLSPSKTYITVVDERGLLAPSVSACVKLASSVAVVSRAEKEYTKLSDKLFDSYGISLILRNEIHPDTAENSFLFDYEGSNIPLSYSGTVFTKAKRHLMNGKTLSPGGFDLPSEYESYIISGVNKLHFASALFELCDITELGTLQFNELCS